MRRPAFALPFGLWVLGALALGACSPKVQSRPDLPVQGAPASRSSPASPGASPAEGTPPPTAAAPPAAPAPASFHVVEAGETLWRIARAYGTTPAALAAENGFAQSAPLALGQRLRLPAPKPLAAVAAAAQMAADSPGGTPRGEAARAPPLEWPLIGVLYARFGPRGETRHDGIDLAVPEGTVVQAAGDGKVLFSGEQRGYGHVVILEHRQGLLTLYSHNARTLVAEGDQVKKGDPIAKVGPAGDTNGPHLHFEVREGSRPRDPLEFLPPPR